MNDKPVPRFLVNPPGKSQELRAKEAPPANLQAGAQSLETQAIRGVESINMLIAERDQLRERSAHLHGQVVELDLRNQSLEQQLNQALARADHYQRFTTEMLTNFNTIEMMVNDMRTKGRHAAFNGKLSTMKELGADDEARLKDLAAKLGPIEEVKS